MKDQFTEKEINEYCYRIFGKNPYGFSFPQGRNDIVAVQICKLLEKTLNGKAHYFDINIYLLKKDEEEIGCTRIYRKEDVDISSSIKARIEGDMIIVSNWEFSLLEMRTIFTDIARKRIPQEWAK